MLKQPSNGFVAGLVIGSLIITIMNIVGFRNNDATSHATVRTSEAAAMAFVSDWTRMRQATWAMDGLFTRVLDSGQQITTKIHQAQQSPNSVNETDNDADYMIGNQHFLCTKGANASCRKVADVSFAAQASMDIASVTNDVEGAAKTYDVQDLSNHCYVLYMRPNPRGEVGQWGMQGTVCFDAQTSAPIRSVIKRSGSTDTVMATSVRNQPRADEIALPSGVIP